MPEKEKEEGLEKIGKSESGGGWALSGGQGKGKREGVQSTLINSPFSPLFCIFVS